MLLFIGVHGWRWGLKTRGKQTNSLSSEPEIIVTGFKLPVWHEHSLSHLIHCGHNESDLSNFFMVQTENTCIRSAGDWARWMEQWIHNKVTLIVLKSKCYNHDWFLHGMNVIIQISSHVRTVRAPCLVKISSPHSFPNLRLSSSSHLRENF